MAIILCWPDFSAATEPVEGKFVQLTWRGEDYLLFATATQYRYHNQMVAQFLGRQGIRKHWVGGDRLVWDDPELEVLGGGRFRLDPAARTLSLWDRSTAYGPFDEAQVRAQLASEQSPWRGFAVAVQ